MARPSNSELQKLWEDRISRAKKKRKDWADNFRVEMARDYFDGKQNPGYPQNEWITINKIYSHLMAQLPSLYAMDPYFYVRLKKSYQPDPNSIALFDQRGKTRQAYLNYLKEELELKPKARLCIQDAHFAYGVIKVHYQADEVKNPDAGNPMKGDDDADLLDEAGSPLLEPETIPINERYAITRVHPDDFLWDEDAGPLKDKWGWVAERVRLTKEEAKKDKRFNKKNFKAAKARSRDDDSEPSESSSPAAKERDVYVLWEIYDLKGKKWLTIMEGGHEPLVMPDELPPGVEDHPFGILRFTIRDKDPYPIPPLSQAIDPQKELNLARSRVLTHRKRFNRKYECQVNKLEDESELSKLEAGEDGTIIRVQMLGAVTPINDAPLDQQNYLEINALNQDINEILGTSDEARALSTADSATQADIIDRRMEVREGDRLSIVVDFLTDVARKLDQLVQTHITQEEAVRVMGPQGEFWSVVKPEDYEEIKGEFQYSVNVGASSPRLPQIERAQWTAFISSVVIPMPHVLTAPHFMKKMAEMYGIEDEAMLEELRQLGQQMMSGQVPMPGQTGSAAGVPTDNPITKVLGAAMGPLGGNVNGGGAPGGMG